MILPVGVWFRPPAVGCNAHARGTIRARAPPHRAKETRGMKLEGSHDVPAPRQTVWEAFLDESHLAFERAFHAADADLHRGLVLVGADRLELFAARNRFLESCGIEKCLPHRLARRRNVVRAFELHAASLLCAMWRGAGSNRTTGMGVAAYRGGSKPHPHREDHRR